MKFSYKGFFFTLSTSISLIFTNQIHAQNIDIDKEERLYHRLSTIIEQGLSYIEKQQIKETIQNSQFKGEWPSTMGLKRGYFLLGKKRRVYDSNCFSVASIHNTLAQIYIKDSSYSIIKLMLDLSYERMLSYRSIHTFNFWNALPPTRVLKKGLLIDKQPLVRRPNHFLLKTKYINNAANVADDADDTSLGLIAIALHQKINKQKILIDSSTASKTSAFLIFEDYRDHHRKNRHWYNYVFGNDHETGAYLTWLGEEYTFKRWNILKTIAHNATFFLPFSECYPHPFKPYIPYGSNDLDAVVNANILSALSINGQLQANGVQNAIRYIEKKSMRKKYDRAGIYYPNRYHFPFAVSQAYVHGVDSLKKSLDYIMEYVLETQKEDGSWVSKRKVNKKDPIQSTAYALNTLVNTGTMEESKTKRATEKAIHYLLEKAIIDEQGVHWTGGVFFSGGTVVRNALTWQSDVYTTAIIINAFVEYKKYLEYHLNL